MIRMVAAFMLLANTAAAVEVSPRPIARDDAGQTIAQLAQPQAAPGLSQLAISSKSRPVERPFQRPDLVSFAAQSAELRAEQNLFAFSPTAPVLSLRPSQRSATFLRVMAERQAVITQGMVCGDPAIQGDAIGSVPGRGSCGIENAVQVRSVAGVQLKPAARMDCTTATALKEWITQGVMPATDNQAASLRIVGGYSCRFRNGAASGKMSEHAFGRAIDIAGIGLKSGREMTLLTGWNTQRDGPALRQMWRAACGPFGTVLGPESNRFHLDHFHFDTARYRSGSYCR